ncbi:MAG: hypothetical protein WBQ91_26475, partial [Candidatus Acidiferrum sp.]
HRNLQPPSIATTGRVREPHSFSPNRCADVGARYIVPPGRIRKPAQNQTATQNNPKAPRRPILSAFREGWVLELL